VAKVSASSKLVNLAVQTGEFFHTPGQKSYVTVQGRTMFLRGAEFRGWLSINYIRSEKTAPAASAIDDALNGLEGKAMLGPEYEVYTRVAPAGSEVHVDLGDHVVTVSAEGWTVQDSCDVRFVRPNGFRPLPAPAHDPRSLEELLHAFITVTDARDLTLVIAWLVGALRGRKPFPLLSFNGEKGSAKSTTTRNLRRLIDPNEALSRFAPREPRDLMISARNSYVLAFENISKIEDWLSDALCAIATGAGSAVRQLHTDTDEIIINVSRPVLLNGINNVLKRSDLIDRAIVVSLDPIPSSKRRTEREVDAAFDAVQGAILGHLLNAVSGALSREALVETTLRPKDLPRMADFAITVVAAEPSLQWEPGTFLGAYADNRNTEIAEALEGNLVAVALAELPATWAGTASELLQAISTSERMADQQWPRTAKDLSARLRDIASDLRTRGIDVQFVRSHGERRISVTRAADAKGVAAEPRLLPEEPF
jgi:hypothetical protein